MYKAKIYSFVLNSIVISRFFTYNCLLDDMSVSNLSEQTDLISFFLYELIFLVIV